MSGGTVPAWSGGLYHRRLPAPAGAFLHSSTHPLHRSALKVGLASGHEGARTVHPDIPVGCFDGWICTSLRAAGVAARPPWAVSR